MCIRDSLGSHLSVVQASACAGGNAEDEIFQWRVDIQNSFEIISEKIRGGDV